MNKKDLFTEEWKACPAPTSPAVSGAIKETKSSEEAIRLIAHEFLKKDPSYMMTGETRLRVRVVCALDDEDMESMFEGLVQELLSGRTRDDYTKAILRDVNHLVMLHTTIEKALGLLENVPRESIHTTHIPWDANLRTRSRASRSQMRREMEIQAIRRTVLPSELCHGIS